MSDQTSEIAALDKLITIGRRDADHGLSPTQTAVRATLRGVARTAAELCELCGIEPKTAAVALASHAPCASGAIQAVFSEALSHQMMLISDWVVGVTGFGAATWATNSSGQASSFGKHATTAALCAIGPVAVTLGMSFPVELGFLNNWVGTVAAEALPVGGIILSAATITTARQQSAAVVHYLGTLSEAERSQLIEDATRASPDNPQLAQFAYTHRIAPKDTWVTTENIALAKRVGTWAWPCAFAVFATSVVLSDLYGEASRYFNSQPEPVQTAIIMDAAKHQMRLDAYLFRPPADAAISIPQICGVSLTFSTNSIAPQLRIPVRSNPPSEIPQSKAVP